MPFDPTEGSRDATALAHAIVASLLDDADAPDAHRPPAPGAETIELLGTLAADVTRGMADERYNDPEARAAEMKSRGTRAAFVALALANVTVELVRHLEDKRVVLSGFREQLVSPYRTGLKDRPGS